MQHKVILCCIICNPFDFFVYGICRVYADFQFPPHSETLRTRDFSDQDHIDWGLLFLLCNIVSGCKSESVYTSRFYSHHAFCERQQPGMGLTRPGHIADIAMDFWPVRQSLKSRQRKEKRIKKNTNILFFWTCLQKQHTFLILLKTIS